MIALSFSHWSSLRQAELDWLIGQSVSVASMIRPCPILSATGIKAHDGRFEQTLGGTTWLVFEEPEDWVFWEPSSNELATADGGAFALGEEAVGNASTYSFASYLSIYDDPLDWLRHGRDGCVVLDWSRAFDRLRYAPRVAVAESLVHRYRRWMKPARMPKLAVLAEKQQERAA